MDELLIEHERCSSHRGGRGAPGRSRRRYWLGDRPSSQRRWSVSESSRGLTLGANVGTVSSCSPHQHAPVLASRAQERPTAPRATARASVVVFLHSWL